MITKEFLLVARDRQSLLVLFAMPVVLILCMSVALRDVYQRLASSGLDVQLDCRDESTFSERLTAELLAQETCRFELMDEPVELRDDAYQALVTIPSGFGDALQTWVRGEAETFGTPIRYDADPALDRVYTDMLAGVVGGAVQAAQLAELTNMLAAATGGSPPSSARTRDLAQQLLSPETDPDRIVPTPLQQTVPGWSIFAMFFISLPLSASMIAERLRGLLRRVRTYPVHPLRLLLGKLAPYFVLNVVQFGLMLAFGLTLGPLIGVPNLALGENAWLVVPVTLAVSFASTSFGLLVAVVAKSVTQASALGSFTTVLMAILGGIMVPVFVMPPAMQVVAHVSPLYWAHQAYLDVFLRDATFVEVGPRLVVLVATALVFLGLSLWRFRWD